MLEVKCKNNEPLNFTDLADEENIVQFQKLCNQEFILLAEKCDGAFRLGNHLIEVDKDNDGNLCIIVYPGNRHI